MKTINKFEGKYSFLSNYHPCVLNYDGITYPTTEHAYQASKTLNRDHKVMISELATPNQSKKAGRMVEVRSDWDRVKYQIMEDILRIKFSQFEFKKLLLETQDAYLIEGNWWHDNIWGICTCSKCDHTGLNELGKILMKIREEIK